MYGLCRPKLNICMAENMLDVIAIRIALAIIESKIVSLPCAIFLSDILAGLIGLALPIFQQFLQLLAHENDYTLNIALQNEIYSKILEKP